MALIDRASLEFEADGTPKNIAEAMDSLLKAKPYLVGGGTTQSADQGARQGGANQLGKDALKTMTADEIAVATKEGRFDQVSRGG